MNILKGIVSKFLCLMAVSYLLFPFQSIAQTHTGGGGGGCAPTGSSILAGNGSGGCSNVTTGSGISYSGGVLSATGSGGTVSTLSVVSANGLAGTVANPTTTPAITLSTSITGILKGNGTAISAGVAGTDYVAPGGALGTPSSGVATNLTGTATGLTAGLSQNMAGGAVNQINYQTAANTTGFLSTANSSVLVTDGSGNLSFNTTLPSGLSATNLTLTTPVLGTPTSGTATNLTGLPLTTGITGTLGVTHGGTGATGTPTNGQIPIGNGSIYVPATITAGSNITVTNGSGTITIAASGAGGTISTATTGQSAYYSAPTVISGSNGPPQKNHDSATVSIIALFFGGI